MTERKNIGWIKFVPSLDLPKERVSIAYDTHDERGVRYAYGYFQFHNGTCSSFWKDGNEQPKAVKVDDIKCWMPIPSFDSMQEEPQVKESAKIQHVNEMCKENSDSLTQEPASEEMWEASKQYALRQVLASTDEEMSEQDYLGLRLFSGFELAVAHKDGANWQKQKDKSKVLTEEQCRKIRDDAFELGKDAMKQRLMAKAVDAVVKVDAGGYPYIDRTIELYDYDKDIPLAKKGDKYKVILIKED